MIDEIKETDIEINDIGYGETHNGKCITIFWRNPKKSDEELLAMIKKIVLALEAYEKNQCRTHNCFNAAEQGFVLCQKCLEK